MNTNMNKVIQYDVSTYTSTVF